MRFLKFAIIPLVLLSACGGSNPTSEAPTSISPSSELPSSESLSISSEEASSAEPSSEAPSSSIESSEKTYSIRIVNYVEGEESSISATIREKKTYFTNVTLGSDTLIKYDYDTTYSHYYLLGVYIANEDALADASKLASYDDSYKKVIYKYGIKLNHPDYFDDRFEGKYLNALGNELEVKDGEIGFDLQINEDTSIHISGKATTLDNSPVFSLVFSKFFIDDELVFDLDESFNPYHFSYAISFNNTTYKYVEEYETFTINSISLIDLSINFQNLVSGIRNYCNDKSIAISELVDENLFLLLNYTGKNNVTINNDLE